MNRTTPGRSVRSNLQRSGFTLIEMLFALVLMMCLLGGYIRAFDEADAIGEMLRANDHGRRMRTAAAVKAIETTMPAEMASVEIEAHPEELNALPFEESPSEPFIENGEAIAEQLPQ